MVYQHSGSGPCYVGSRKLSGCLVPNRNTETRDLDMAVAGHAVDGPSGGSLRHLRASPGEQGVQQSLQLLLQPVPPSPSLPANTTLIFCRCRWRVPVLWEIRPDTTPGDSGNWFESLAGILFSVATHSFSQLPPYLFFFIYFACTHSMWKFPGQGSNLCHSSDNAESLTTKSPGNSHPSSL